MDVRAHVTDLTETRMTSKGQVLIPKAVRDRVGLTPGAAVTVGVNERGEAVVAPRAEAEAREERIARIRRAIDSVAGKYDTGFATTDDYMDFIRPWRRDPP
jgi:AbrB family looped-hinge helix DNA binding protein